MSNSNMKEVIESNFTQYAGSVLQSRALVDARDCLKPSARQIFYCMYTDKFIHSKPFKKTLKSIGSAMRMYIHGDTSCEGVIMRAGQPFSMRYPLVEVEGSYGNLMESGNWAAPRYTSARLSALTEYLFKDIDKNTISEWRDNYDDTEQYPSVLTSKGYFNIVNGTLGIGVGAAASIPQYNLKDVNHALIKLLWNSDIDFDEIYCAPDFATGAILLNEQEIKDSMKIGSGSACKLRSVIEYNEKEKCLIATEIPYGVYTNTICGELEAILESEENIYFDRFNDLTGATPLIKIYLRKNANVSKAIKYLYKNTSLQSYYGINFTMLDNGRFPRQFGWKEILQSYLDHQIIVYTKGFEFDLKKIKDRLHIIDGLLKAYDAIDEVIQTIKTSSSAAAANERLCTLLGIDAIQAKAILSLKLSSLSKLDITKLCNEKTNLEGEKNRIEDILSDETLLKKEIERDLLEVANKFGDERRTKIMNLSSDENEEPIEVKSLLVNLTNKNNIFVSETTTLYTQRRGGAGNKIKLDKGEYIISTCPMENIDTLLLFTKESGMCYSILGNELEVNTKISIESLVDIKNNESVCAITTFNKKTSLPYTIIFTKNGIMKKSLLSEYIGKKRTGLKAIELEKGDSISKILFTNEKDNVGVLTKQGQFLIFNTSDVRPLGRVAKGVKAIKLNEDDYVVSVRVIPANYNYIVSISREGYIKKSEKSEFSVGTRYTKGTKIQKLLNNTDAAIDFLPINDEKDIYITSSSSQIKISIQEIPTLSRGAQGNKSMKIKSGERVVSLAK